MVITSPKELVGDQCWIWDGIPLPLRKELLTGKKRLSSASRRQDFEVLIASTHAGKKGDPIKINPRQLCDDFLRLKKTNEALAQFLNKCGEWDESLNFWGRRGYNSERRTRICNPQLFWEARTKIAEAREQGVSAWHDSPYASDLKFQRRQQFPHLVHTDVYCFDAFMHSITLDLLRGVKYRLCARPDCGVTFSIDSHHKRAYCQNYCAHLESLRRQRQKAKKTKRSGK